MLPASAVLCEDSIAEEGKEVVAALGADDEVLELRRENSLDVLLVWDVSVWFRWSWGGCGGDDGVTHQR